MRVFVLEHTHPISDGDEASKLIGVYSSREAAQAAIERLRTLPGFSSYPNGFNVDPYDVDQDSWEQGFVIALKGE